MEATIYKIENQQTLDCYVGSTVNYSRRKKRHIQDLTKGIHHSIIMQRAFNKYGSYVFVFCKIETFTTDSKENILKREQYYIDLLSPKYNVCKIAGSQLGAKRSDEFKKRCADRMRGTPAWNRGKKTKPHSEKTKKKMSKAHMGHKTSSETKAKIKNAVSRQVLQLNNNGELIAQWPSAKEAANSLNMSYPRLIEFLNGKSNIETFNKFKWKRI